MQSSRKSIIRVILVWLGLIFLLFIDAYFGGQKIAILPYYGYMLVTSFSLTKFIEKRSVTERFGLQRNNVLGLLAVTYLGLTIAYFFGRNNLEGIFLAPLFEEIFFQGYMLGSLSQHNRGELKWILLTSVLFALGHIIRYYPTFPLYQSIYAILNAFIGGMFFGLLYVWSRTILWSFSAHMIYNLFPPYRVLMIRVFAIILVSYLILKLYAMFKRK